MGLIISRFRKKQSTKDLLEEIQKNVEAIEEYRETTEQRQKKLVGSLVLYSIVLYLVAAVVFYFYYFPNKLRERLLYATPFIIFPFLIYSLKRLLTWYYRRKISKNEEKLKSLRERQEKILEQVMETETYKVAKEILELYAPDQLRRNQMLKTPTPVGPIAPTPASQHADVRRRVVSTAPTPQSVPLGSMGARPLGPQVLPHQTPIYTSRPLPITQSTPVRPAPSSVRGDGAPPGPPMPRPVLPRERGYLDRFVEYLVGDGPANRFALVCRQCESHNGMALKDEFQYLAFRCAYCFYWNPARKQRPSAPRLENLAPPLPPSLPIAEDQEDEDDEQESSSGEEEEDDDDEGGVEEEESGSSSSAEEDDEEEEGVVSSEVSSTKATSSQGVCRPQQAGSLEDVAKSTPSSEPSTSDDHQPCETDLAPLDTKHAPLLTSSCTTPSSTTEAEETE
ncbi:endoplasmic reticulum junction formation protein lunapark-A isoform X5 [Procambarus clarkii]|uniref:endoplasmic reticulum junction formation protein lunapark-A isoform X5 n=1 Tax=Procambarus clarkii TaxID=6728 RepID=UPI003742851B